MARPRRRSNLTGDDLGKYGSVAAGTVNVDQAAARMNIPKSQVREVIKQSKDAHRQTYFRAISGRRGADATGQGSPKGMLLGAFGRGARGAAVNAKAAADKLGVAVSTVRRWASGKQKPSAAHLDALQKASRQATTTKAGRKSATADFRSSAAGQKAITGGTTLWISGNQGPGGNDTDRYTRDRTVAFPIDVDDIQAMLRAYEEDGDAGVHGWLTDIADQKYVGDWGYISIDDFGFGQQRGRQDELW
ncbi:helix-turn-helix transcriptional regulator [Mycobacterium sp. NPDC049093]